MELESYSIAGVIHVRMYVRAEFLRARVSAIHPHCLTYARAHGIESNLFQLNNSTFFFFRITFSFNFFTLVSFSKTFFKMAAYS